MPRIEARITRPRIDGPFDAFYRLAEQKIERAALIATDRARRAALTKLRSEMSAAGLGKLGQGVGSTSDLARGRSVHRYAGGGFSASGVLFVRGSERTKGAIEAYTSGAEIRPVRGRWLWIATDNIPRVTGRERMTPSLYIKNGFERKIGPLVQVKASNGNPLLIVRNVGVPLSGARRGAKALRRNGLPRKGQARTEFIVAFIGIPRTSRAARVDVGAIMSSVQAELPALFNQAMGVR